MMEIWPTALNIIIEPFTFTFMQKALVAALVIALASGLLSCFLVLKGWALMGDAVAHAILPGVVFAFILKIPLIIGAFAAGMICSLSAGFLQENSRIKSDTALGIVFSGMFGLGLVLYLKIETHVHLDRILFGNMLGLSFADIILSTAIAAVTALIMGLKWRDFLLFCFDPQQARAVGLSTRWLHYGLLMLLSLNIIGALSAIGIILSVALLIAPGAIAYLLTDRFHQMLIFAVLIAVGCAILGIWASFHLNSAPAPTIVLIMTIVFILVFMFHPKSGLLNNARLNRKRIKNR